MISSQLAELATIASQIEDLNVRILNVAEHHSRIPGSAVASDLYDAERGLRSTQRAIRRAVEHLEDIA